MVVEVKPSLLVSLKLMILIKKIIFLSEHQQPQIGETSSDSQSTVIVRNQDDAIARLDSAAGKFFFFFLSPSLFICGPFSRTVNSLSAGQFLLQRTYQGLDMRIGQDAPGVLEQGRSGVARGYQDDVDRLS